MRRLVAGAAAGLALLAVAPQPAHADDIPRGWEGSRLVAPEGQVRSSRVEITAEFHRDYAPWARDLLGRRYRAGQMYAQAYVVVPAGLPAACGPAGSREVPTSMTPSNATVDEYPTGERIPVTTVTAEALLPCNGMYDVRVDAELDQRIGSREHAYVLGNVRVSAPPPDVSKASAVHDGGAAVVSWTPLASADRPPDFLGYRVDRRVGEGGWEPIATKLSSDTKSFEDADRPSDGAVSYRVRTRRAAPPSGESVSDGVAVELQSSSTTVPGGTDGGTTVPGADGGTTVPGGTDGGGAGGADGGRTGGGSTDPQRRGRTGQIGTRAPRLGTPSQANFPPLLTPDAGSFDEEIDYGDRSLAGEGEDDELSSLFYEEDTGRGMAVPVATGFVLAAWAFHLRFLAKAARPVPATAGPAHGRGRGRGRPEEDLLPVYEPMDHDPFLDPIEPDPFDAGFGPVVRAEPARPAPKVPYQAPAHYRPPTLADRYDPFARS